MSEEASLDQQAMNICLEEIAAAARSRRGPNFLVLLGNRYGWLPPPPQIPAVEFERIRRRVPEQADRKLLKEWYRKDENAVPAAYFLIAREKGGPYEDRDTWGPVEGRLLDLGQGGCGYRVRRGPEVRRVGYRAGDP